MSDEQPQYTQMQLQAMAHNRARLQSFRADEERILGSALSTSGKEYKPLPWWKRWRNRIARMFK